MIFEECDRAGLPHPTVTDERGVVRVTFKRPNLLSQKNEPIKSLKEVENIVLSIIKNNPGISRIKIIPLINKSEATIRRALKALGEMGYIEYRGSKKTGGYFRL
ncbi:MAG: winged helix-turn-helix transcriptional regulator [Barnesiella sp.]|nr:winged helix-turn-helix transcriptional regulator [Barnesiella sp.]